MTGRMPEPDWIALAARAEIMLSERGYDEHEARFTFGPMEPVESPPAGAEVLDTAAGRWWIAVDLGPEW